MSTVVEPTNVEKKEEILHQQQRCEPIASISPTARATQLPTTTAAFAAELARKIGSKIPYPQTEVLQFLADTLQTAETERYELKLDHPCPFAANETEAETILVRILNYLYVRYYPCANEEGQVMDGKNMIAILQGLTFQICAHGYDWSQPIAGGTRSILHACVELNFDWFLHSRTSIIEAMAKLMGGLLTQPKEHQGDIDFLGDPQTTPLLSAFWSNAGREIMPIIHVLRQHSASLEKARNEQRHLFWFTYPKSQADIHCSRLELLLTWLLSEPHLSRIILPLKGMLRHSSMYDSYPSTSNLHCASLTFSSNPHSEPTRIYNDLICHLCQLLHDEELLARTLDNIAFRGPDLEIQQAAVVSKEAAIRQFCQTQLQADLKIRCVTEVIYQRLTSTGYHVREFNSFYESPLIHAAVNDVLAWWPPQPANSLLTIPLRLEYTDLLESHGPSSHPNLLQVLLALPPNQLRRFEVVQDTLLPLMQRMEPKYFGLTNISHIFVSSIRLIIRSSHRPRHQHDFTWRLYDCILRKMTEFYEARLPAQETELCFQAFLKELEVAAANPSIPDQRACANGIMLLIELFRSHGIDAIDWRPNRPGSDEDFYSLICVNPQIMTMWLQLHRPTSSATSTSINHPDTYAATLVSLTSATGSTLPTTSSSSSALVPASASSTAWSPHPLAYDFSPLHAIWPKRVGSRRLAEESLLDTILRLRHSSITTTGAPITDAKGTESLSHGLVLRSVRDEFDQYYAPIFRSALNPHLIPDLTNLIVQYLSG